MSSKKFLSTKKTAQQTISISPALKDWITRYVHVNYQKNQEDSRFKSVSAFICEIMEGIMVLFQNGKTINDLNIVQDKKIQEEKKVKREKKVKSLFEPFSFNATIPLYEMVCKFAKYSPFSFEFNTRFLLLYLDKFKREVSSHNYKDVDLFFEEIRRQRAKSTVSKDFTLELFQGKNREPAKGTFEFFAKYENIHFENCKFFAAVFGMLGVRVTDFIYSPNNYYCRMELIETNLLFEKVEEEREKLPKKERLKERLKLIEENVEYVANFNGMLDDEDYYFWMKLSNDHEIYISFKTQAAFNKWIKNIEVHLRKYGKKEEFYVKILQFFNKLHWIRIENKKNLSFRIERALEENKEQKQYLVSYLSKLSKITEIEGIYYLK